ncbi:MAG: hypothetical protein H3C47_11085 [Candidatus Cloacimonetes bacterium]|nr:hypothetical protein [Candidatus Cloacimonadota bacterium]
MQKLNAKWENDGCLYMVCSRCFERVLSPEIDSPAAASMAQTCRMHLKTSLAQKGLAPKHRAISTSCLGICPENEIVVSVLNTSSQTTECLSFPKNLSPEEIGNQVLDSCSC